VWFVPCTVMEELAVVQCMSVCSGVIKQSLCTPVVQMCCIDVVPSAYTLTVSGFLIASTK